MAEITGGFQARFCGFCCPAAPWVAASTSLVEKLSFVNSVRSRLNLSFESVMADVPVANAAAAWSSGIEMVQETL
ncbi:MAG: hypothetical protein AAFN80_11855 [Pseudomonadota bacterium]